MKTLRLLRIAVCFVLYYRIQIKGHVLTSNNTKYMYESYIGSDRDDEEYINKKRSELLMRMQGDHPHKFCTIGEVDVRAPFIIEYFFNYFVSGVAISLFRYLVSPDQILKIAIEGFLIVFFWLFFSFILQVFLDFIKLRAAVARSS